MTKKCKVRFLSTSGLSSLEENDSQTSLTKITSRHPDILEEDDFDHIEHNDDIRVRNGETDSAIDVASVREASP